MAAIVAGVSAANTTDNAALTTGSFTPAASDLLVAFAIVGGQASGGTFTDSQGLGWTQVQSAAKRLGADTVVCAVANALASASGMTVTFTPAGSPTSTGIAISVLRVSGMTRTGLPAVLQSAKVDDAAGGSVPEASFSASALTTNPTLGAVGNGANPGGQTPPTNWTEQHDIGYGTPNNGLETVTRDSGFTSTTITWGAASPGASSIGVIIVELDTSALPAPTVSSVSANSGTTAGGTSVTITGTNFVATPTSITFGGSAATNIAFVNSTTLTCTTPAHAAGAVDVVVTNPDTQTGTGTNAFTYVAPAGGLSLLFPFFDGF